MTVELDFERVHCWEEDVTIPTYRVGTPEKNPMFLEKRVYQGSSGVVYPYPIIDRVESIREPATYRAVFLENRYLKIMFLPALGGRVQMALDKTNDYHFVYYNRVIKPALVGLAGPWISGGIEFNWPQHHRPSTFEPVDCHFETHADGSATVWMNEVERMFRTKGMVGFRLYPDAAFLELNVQLYNRTDTPQTFLWWANPAVHVNDDYQSVFPPDVYAVMDHGKRAVSDFPIATGTYYKVNYAPGTDISRYKNVPVPTSFMAYHSDFDFIGCYDHGRAAGMMHVANHHTVPGKKQWTWGNGEFGRAWDRQLTDEDGPYIELMCGAYTDNQPDFSWLQPGEEKRFTQTFMPYKNIGPAKNATREVIINLEVADGAVTYGVYVSRPRTVAVQLLVRSQLYREQTLALSPTQTHVEAFRLNAAPQEVTLRVLDDQRHELIRYTPLPPQKHPIPEPALPAPDPADVPTNEELYLHGLHLEQYRHATYAPEPYYEEALRRDAGDARCNTAMGLLKLRRGQFDAAEGYFRAALKRLTMRNANPYDGEPSYYLGLTLRLQGRLNEAYDALYKATWNMATRSAAAFELARIDCARGDYARAMHHLHESLALNERHHQARHLLIVCLRRLGHDDAASQNIDHALALDPFNAGALYEQALLRSDDRTFRARMRDWKHNYIELALDYAHAGQYSDAITLLKMAPNPDPMTYYLTAWLAHQQGDKPLAERFLDRAALVSLDYCFPNIVECVPALHFAQQQRPHDGAAAYLLGLFCYAHRCHTEAIALWERAAQAMPTYPTVQRNLGLAYMNKLHDPDRARSAYERAFALQPSDARVLFELDQLLKKLNTTPAERLTRLQTHWGLVQQRDDLMIEYITLLNLTGCYDEALHLLRTHEFHPWEGGEGKATEQYVLALLQLAREQLTHGDPQAALSLLEQAKTSPDNLNEGRLAGAHDNHINYTMGLAYEALGDSEHARACFETATRGDYAPTSPLYYNDQPVELMLYQALAYAKLGQSERAEAIYKALIDYGNAHMNDAVRIDYFAVSLPNFLVFEDDLTLRHQIHCHYVIALGSVGLQQWDAAEAAFERVLTLDPNHVGAVVHRGLLNQEQHP